MGRRYQISCWEVLLALALTPALTNVNRRRGRWRRGEEDSSKNHEGSFNSGCIPSRYQTHGWNNQEGPKTAAAPLTSVWPHPPHSSQTLVSGPQVPRESHSSPIFFFQTNCQVKLPQRRVQYPSSCLSQGSIPRAGELPSRQGLREVVGCQSHPSLLKALIPLSALSNQIEGILSLLAPYWETAL